jgi:hypothetical protein
MKTIQELILDVQDRISLPLDDDDRWNTSALIRAFNNALDDKLTPDLIAEGSNYLVHRDVVALTANGVPVFPLNSIPINKRAVGRALREVKYLPAGKTKIEDELNCPAISLEEKDMFSTESEIYGSSVPYVFLENDSLRLVGGDLAGSIVMYYSLEPSTLENTSKRYATITGWSGTTITASSGDVNTTPSDDSVWDAYFASGTKFVDIYNKSTGAIIKPNVRVTRSGSSYTIAGLSDDEINQIKVYQPGGFPVSGPYESELLLLPAGKAEFSTIPYEFDQLLVLYVCERVLESIGDTEGLGIVMGKIKETRDSISRVTGNRLQGERRKLTDRRSIARIQRGQKWTRSYTKNHT